MLDTPVSSGIKAIDDICCLLKIGDNVVWRTSDHMLYSDVSHSVLSTGRKLDWPLRYFRFANHEALFPDSSPDFNDIKIIKPEPEKGFEHFISSIHNEINATGTGGIYIFDSLSDLQEMYFSDRMIGCFFELTCPYLRRMETIAYFRLDPAAHSRHAVDPIRKTTQVWLDAYSLPDSRYISPLKTREDPEGNRQLLYKWEERAAMEITESQIESSVRQQASWTAMPATSARQIDMWDTALMRFDDLQQVQETRDGNTDIHREKQRLQNIAERMLLSHDSRILELIQSYFQPADLSRIWKRMIGTGQIGGKAVGMLLARAVLRTELPDIHHKLEDHDTFFVGSDVYYTYLVENDCWWERRSLHSPESSLKTDPEIMKAMLNGSFPSRIIQALTDMLEYYGKSPIIVRSSSLLEDNFGNAFAGKYESYFCSNQGSIQQRLDELLQAIRRIYAGTLSYEALSYRRERGVLDQDEQMALLVQRVSGKRRGNSFFPDLAGVGLSWNPYTWHPAMDATAGMSRIVIGLGTRAVDRTQNDSARIAAHDEPTRQPEASRQQQIDVLDLNSGELSERTLRKPEELMLPDIFLERDWRKERLARQMGLKQAHSIGLDTVLGSTDLPQLLRNIGSCIEKAYGTPIEFEYTAQYMAERWHINLLQCRPFQISSTNGQGTEGASPAEILNSLGQEECLIHARGPVIGQGRRLLLDYLIWIDPQSYSRLDDPARFEETANLARVIQELREQNACIFLFGPGRWGTSTPSMGIPARFGQIRGIQVLGEMDWMHENLSPDLSLGTHFFHDLVEENVLYTALQQENSNFNWEALEREAQHSSCLRILKSQKKAALHLIADPVRRELLVYKVRAE
ncbi:PEP/pyruvate-binding domain-containing protein [Spirochaeta dissipatitropha]